MLTTMGGGGAVAGRGLLTGLLSGGMQQTCSKLSRSHIRTVRSAAAVAIRNSVGCIAMAEMLPVCCVNSCTSLCSVGIALRRVRTRQNS